MFVCVHIMHVVCENDAVAYDCIILSGSDYCMLEAYNDNIVCMHISCLRKRRGRTRLCCVVWHVFGFFFAFFAYQ